jgi:Fe-S cluster assembly scaffold protein SufB
VFASLRHSPFRPDFTQIASIGFEIKSKYLNSLKKLKDLNEVDPELLQTFEKLGISLTEQKRLANVAVDVVFDSVSIGTTFQEELSQYGIIFASISEAIHTSPELIKKYLDAKSAFK